MYQICSHSHLAMLMLAMMILLELCTSARSKPSSWDNNRFIFDIVSDISDDFFDKNSSLPNKRSPLLQNPNTIQKKRFQISSRDLFSYLNEQKSSNQRYLVFKPKMHTKLTIPKNNLKNTHLDMFKYKLVKVPSNTLRLDFSNSVRSVDNKNSIDKTFNMEKTTPNVPIIPENGEHPSHLIKIIKIPIQANTSHNEDSKLLKTLQEILQHKRKNIFRESSKKTRMNAEENSKSNSPQIPEKLLYRIQFLLAFIGAGVFLLLLVKLSTSIYEYHKFSVLKDEIKKESLMELAKLTKGECQHVMEKKCNVEIKPRDLVPIIKPTGSHRSPTHHHHHHSGKATSRKTLTWDSSIPKSNSIQNMPKFQDDEQYFYSLQNQSRDKSPFSRESPREVSTSIAKGDHNRKNSKYSLLDELLYTNFQVDALPHPKKEKYHKRRTSSLAFCKEPKSTFTKTKSLRNMTLKE